MDQNKTLNAVNSAAILEILKDRFMAHQQRFSQLSWQDVRSKLVNHPAKLWSLNEMEKSGGEPNLLSYDEEKGELVFCDFSKESPSGRRSLCYDAEALEARKKFKPADNAMDVAARMGVALMDETAYRKLQSVNECDTKTSSWLDTPERIRKLGGAIFGDFRYGEVFIYHNGADSYYAARGFRALLKV